MFSQHPRPMEDYQHYYGMALYSTSVPARWLREGPSALKFKLHDLGHIFLDDCLVKANWDRNNPVPVPLPTLGNFAAAHHRHCSQCSRWSRPGALGDRSGKGNVSLRILAETMGRINFGSLLDLKGLVSPDVRLNNHQLMGWKVRCWFIQNSNSIQFNWKVRCWFINRSCFIVLIAWRMELHGLPKISTSAAERSTL